MQPLIKSETFPLMILIWRLTFRKNSVEISAISEDRDRATNYFQHLKCDVPQKHDKYQLQS